MTKYRFALSRFSFRQLLLVAFLLIATLLSGTSLHALQTLEKTARHSRETAREAVELTELQQMLAERTAVMERSARQFLVLDDPSFRQRSLETAATAREAMLQLSDSLPMAPPTLFKDWDQNAQAALKTLEAGPAQRVALLPTLDEAFARLPAINARLAEESKREVERRNQVLSDELEHQRRVLSAQVVIAIILSVALALSFGVWLARPLAALERAIERLGDNRFDEPVEVRGPADLRRLGQQLDWLRQRLSELESDKDRFLRHISHELKTPLAALREGVALLEDEVAGELSDSQREIAGILRQNTMALQSQIEDLLRYNAAAFEAQRLHCAAIDLQPLLQQAIESQRLQWQARRLRVFVEGGAGAVRADADKLSVAFGNLLSNAIRFSPEGGTIRFVLSPGGRGAQVDCIDEGPGIADEDASRVFEPFYQGQRQPPGPRRGSGIGLSIVREYIEAHGGRIQLLATEAGAHFRLDLPDEKQ